MNAAELQARIDATKARILLYEDALLAFSTTGIQSYTLDTGQTRQTVTRVDISSMENILDKLMDRCVTLEARLNGSGSYTAVPPW